MVFLGSRAGGGRASPPLWAAAEWEASVGTRGLWVA